MLPTIICVCYAGGPESELRQEKERGREERREKKLLLFTNYYVYMAKTLIIGIK